VKFELVDLSHDSRVLGEPAITDASGFATVRQNLPGCPAIELALRAVAPAGYHPTTSATLRDESNFTYGFARAK
jgi:hypothetical protein